MFPIVTKIHQRAVRQVIELSPHRLRFSVNWRRSMEYAAEPGDVSAGLITHLEMQANGK